MKIERTEAVELLHLARDPRYHVQAPACTTLIGRYLPQITGFLRQRFGDLLDVADRESLALEALVWFISAPKRYDPEKSNFETIGCIVARTAALKFLRAQGDALKPLELGHHVPSANESGFDRVDAEIDAAKVIALALNVLDLDDLDRDILLVSKEDRDWQKQLGEKLGKTPTNIATRWKRLRGRLHDLFEKSKSGGHR